MPDFWRLLTSHGILALADVRRYPVSRRHPHFSADNLASVLPEGGVAYHALSELGGRRPARPDSINLAWRNAAFRGYADYMETTEFQEGIERLEKIAQERPTAMMCAEALWWQCHRGLIADFMKAHGWDVRHITGPGKTEPHPYTSAAQLVDGRLSYLGDRTRKLL